MSSLANRLILGTVLGIGMAAMAAPANAGVSISVGVGGPYYGYTYDRPCYWYREHDYPAPRRCYDYYRGIWGPRIYVDGGFVFRDRDHWNRWHDRDDYRHWRSHDWGHDGDRDRGRDRDRGHGHDRGHDWH